MNEQISTIQTREVLELMRNLAPILNQKELFEFMLFSNRVVERYMPEHYKDELSEEVTEMKKDIEWLKNEMRIRGRFPAENEYVVEQYRQIMELINQLDEPRKPVIPQFVAVWIEETKKQSKSLVFAITHIYDNNEIGKSPNKEEKRIFQWMELADNEEVFARAWLDGYEVEKEILWEIPIPYLITSSGHIQYLTYDPKARTYFASRQNGQLKQTFNAKDLASVPTQYRHYAELCDFKKI